MNIDLKAIRAGVIPDCYGFTEIDAEQVIALLDRLEAAEKDAARKVIRVKLGNQYGNDLNGHWFYLHPADDEAKKVIDAREQK